MKRLIQYSEENPFLHALISRGLSILLLLALTLGVFSQSALARNTYVITDGDKVVVHTSFATDPTDVLQELGMSLGESDTVTTKPEEDGVSEIVVSRSNAVTLDDRGQIHAISTTAETVGELLEQYDIDLTEALVLSTSPDSKIYNGMKLVVSSLTYGEETVEEAIAYNEITCDVPWLEAGKTFQATPGKEGLQRTVYDVTYEDGQAIRKAERETIVLSEPMDKVTYVGTGASAASADSAELQTLTTPTGETLTYTTKLSCEATAYTCEGQSWNTTATGTTARVGCIAVDPSVIALGTQVYVETADGSFVYGCATAEDTGGAIKGNIIDLYFDTEDECWNFGRRAVNVYILA